MTGLTILGADLSLGGRAVLRGVDCRFGRGRIAVILGPNGAGKSSLLSLLAGLRRPERGHALLDGGEIADMTARDRARRIGYLPQSAELHWDLVVEEVVALGRLARRGRFGRLSEADRTAIDRALDDTDTRRFAGRRTASLSGGERARVLLARVLAGEPEWILADEPLAALDPAHRIEVLASLQRAAAGGAGVILVLHDLTLAHWVADDVVLLDAGRVIAAGDGSVLATPGLLETVYGIEMERVRRADGSALVVPTPRLARRAGGAGETAAGETAASMPVEPPG